MRITQSSSKVQQGWEMGLQRWGAVGGQAEPGLSREGHRTTGARGKEALLSLSSLGVCREIA